MGTKPAPRGLSDKDIEELREDLRGLNRRSGGKRKTLPVKFKSRRKKPVQKKAAKPFNDSAVILQKPTPVLKRITVLPRPHKI